MQGQAPKPQSQRAAGRPLATSQLFVAQESFWKGFFSRLHEFLTEKPVKIAPGAPGALTQDTFGTGLLENLKEWLRPLPPQLRRPAGSRMVIEWKPWYAAFWENLRDTLFPPKLPPLRVTSKPVQVRDIWSRNEQFRRAQAISLTVHALIAVLLVAPLVHKIATDQNLQVVKVREVIDISPWLNKLPPGKDKAGGGGGGGERNPNPTTKGKLPKFAMAQLTPPMIPRNPNPKLAAEPTVVVPPEIRVPNPALPNYGDPLAKLVTDSAGPGGGGGFGTGCCGGVGSGSGRGVGPGEGWGIGGGLPGAGRGGYGEPECAYCPNPQFSEEARKAKHQGTVVLRLIVTEDGRPTNVTVARGLGLGLDEKAAEAVRTWRFKPALAPNGKPAAVWVTIEVTFRLL